MEERISDLERSQDIFDYGYCLSINTLPAFSLGSSTLNSMYGRLAYSLTLYRFLLLATSIYTQIFAPHLHHQQRRSGLPFSI
tara:strand:+ start:870 stop:1115 length:246 start_codon:yes stop_codon:yes gene_type:complete